MFIKFTAKTSNLEGLLQPFHFHFASFFKFMVANLSLTQFVTCARPLYGVYRIACFSFASANTRSIFSFRNLYNSAYFGVWRISSASSMYSDHICFVTVFTQSFDSVHKFLVGRFFHISQLLLYSLYPSRFVVLYFNT